MAPAAYLWSHIVHMHLASGCHQRQRISVSFDIKVHIDRVQMPWVRESHNHEVCAFVKSARWGPFRQR